MYIHLKNASNIINRQVISVTVQERLPFFVQKPVDLDCVFQVQFHNNYYLFLLQSEGTIDLTCQRCLGSFAHTLKMDLKLAICQQESMRPHLETRYDCIINTDDELNVVELITDELHLSLPEKHLDSMDCDKNISQYIQN